LYSKLLRQAAKRTRQPALATDREVQPGTGGIEKAYVKEKETGTTKRKTKTGFLRKKLEEFSRQVLIGRGSISKNRSNEGEITVRNISILNLRLSKYGGRNPRGETQRREREHAPGPS